MLSAVTRARVAAVGAVARVRIEVPLGTHVRANQNMSGPGSN